MMNEQIKFEFEEEIIIDTERTVRKEKNMNTVEEHTLQNDLKELRDKIISLGHMFLCKYRNTEYTQFYDAIKELVDDVKENNELAMADLSSILNRIQNLQENIEYKINGLCTEEPHAATTWKSGRAITSLERSAECILAIFDDGGRPDFVRWNFKKKMWVDPDNSDIEYGKRDPWKWADIVEPLSPNVIDRRPFCLSGYYV